MDKVEVGVSGERIARQRYVVWKTWTLEQRMKLAKIGNDSGADARMLQNWLSVALRNDSQVRLRSRSESARTDSADSRPASGGSAT